MSAGDANQNGATWRLRRDEAKSQGQHPRKVSGVLKATAGRGSSKSSKGSVKGKIRGIERLLAHRGDSMPPAARAAAQAEVESLKALAEDRERRERERTLSKKYHMVKFFERRKIQRRLEALAEQAKRPGSDAAALAARMKELERDLVYVRHFPKEKPYIALYPSDGHTESSRLAVEAVRNEIEAALAGGEHLVSGAEHGDKSEEDNDDGANDDDFFLAED
jgi:rRNA-processing protein Efg1